MRQRNLVEQNTNKLFTGIQAYQLYKINKNTKGLRS